MGYYYEYSDKVKFGLCLYTENYPGLRRACSLDWAGGVMGVMLGVTVIIAECVATYINQRDVSSLEFVNHLYLAIAISTCKFMHNCIV